MKKEVAIKKARYRASDFGLDVLVFLLMFITDSTIFMRSLNAGIQSFRLIFPTLGLAVICLYRLVKGNFTINQNAFFFLLTWLGLTCVTNLISDGNVKSISVYILKYVLCLFVSLSINHDLIVRSYLRIMRIIAVVSLAMYIVYQVNPAIIERLPRFLSSGPEKELLEWRTLLFSNIPLSGGEDWGARNFGPFWEPGAFAVHLNLASFLSLFSDGYEQRNTKWDLFLFGAAIVTTLSTGGIAAFFVLLLIYLMQNDVEQKKLKFSVIVFAIFGFVYLFYINPHFIEMLTHRMNTTNGSFDSRVYSVFGNIDTFLSSPFWGVGLTNVDSCLESYYYNVVGGSISAIHNTNTLLIYFAAGGLFVGVLHSWLWYKYIAKSASGFAKIALFIFIFVLLSNEDMTGSFIAMLLPLYALSFKKGGKNESFVDKQLPSAKHL